MNIFLKVIAGVLIAAIITLVLSKQCQEISLLLTLCVSCLVITAMVSYLQPVLDFAQRLVEIGDLNRNLVNVLFRAVGICLLSEIAELVCVDAGNQTLSKILHIITSVVIICISIPLLEELLTLIEKALGNI